MGPLSAIASLFHMQGRERWCFGRRLFLAHVIIDLMITPLRGRKPLPPRKLRH